MQFACPKCQTHLNFDPELAGKLARCPGCGSRIVLPGASPQKGPARTGASPAPASAAATGGEHDPANAGLWKSLGLGVGITLAIVGALLPFRRTFVGEVYFSGGWVNWVEMLLFAWGLAILIIKLGKAKRQRDALLLDVLPTEVATQITPENVDAFLGHLNKLPLRLRDSLMVNRIRKGLEMFRARRDNGEVASLLETLSAVDANRVSGSYSLVKVFLWAIPILGFIGTVLGLSFAMAGFGSADLTNVDELKKSVGTITGGLATAFNTTLLGLLLSMFLMFPMSALQKREEDNLTDIDAFCTEVLLPRLNDGGGGLKAEEPGAWLEILARKASDQQAAFLDKLEGTLHALKEMIDRTDTMIADRVATSVEHNQELANAHLAALEKGISALNGTLARLGERQVVVQPVKRGWFGR